MKKLLLFFTVCIMLTGCGKSSDTDIDDTTTTTTTEETSVEETSSDTSTVELSTEKKTDVTDEGNIIRPKEDNTDDDTKNKNDVIDNPEIEKASPVDNVKNSLFIEASNAVRSNCNSSSNADVNAIGNSLNKMVQTKEESVYANTAVNLIKSYARLNDCRQKIYDNNDVVTDEDIASLTSIEDGLSANVEIFLNASTTSVMDANFGYNKELSNLEASLSKVISQ